MKKLLFFVPLLLLLTSFAPVPKQTKGQGAVKVQELGQAIYSALQQNQFGSLENYLPDDTHLRILKRRSSEDMRQLLEKTTPNSIRENLKTEFSHITEQTTANTFNWSEWQLAGTQATRRDKKNPLLYSLELTLANAAGNEHRIMAEAVKVRGRYFLFKQMVFKAEK